MKRIIMITGLIITVAQLTGCGSTQNQRSQAYKKNAQLSTLEETRTSADAKAADGRISEEEAKDLALAKVPGAAEEEIQDFKIEYDDGRIVYEGKIYHDEMEYEFEIDGYNGAIRKWEVESIYD